MNRRALLVSALLALPAFAQDGELSQEAQARLTEMINIFARCSGVYEVTSEFYKVTGEPATAEYVHNLANGAASAAMYLLGQESVLKGNPPKPYGEFMPYVEDLADGPKSSMRALLEMKDTKQFLKRFQDCAALIEAQEAALQALRNDTYRR